VAGGRSNASCKGEVYRSVCVCVCMAVQLSGVGEWFIRQQEIVQENSVGIWYSPSSYACRVKVLK
jgi:hypothetical protein